MKTILTILLVISILWIAITFFLVYIPNLDEQGNLSTATVLGGIVGSAIIPGFLYLWLRHVSKKK